ncbi:PTS lactose/cellobiose transporter subunit IIA [Clostridium neonatale]|uniref:PTS lactose/cellobiose transporter subunit IIA n=1 Tax=Clostridium neonatale TaxID=137838 RepID=A0A2A7MCQ3_9CLOT|nr:PTS lactose/cellobiose transporter subunit IIA [Clostridium neonatale]PEG27051.1 PTS lactose/cellobiose transporter subunit IIA [Clostridium neonatale]PEG29193.1 PTS lactose/cellobiose transporter subunit IIA [Clostridium neonatale]CAH0435543.1 PTS system, lactose/cellobiose-family IIA component [Clostridium neonatale]
MENKYESSFELILNAGNSKSKSLMAIESAREFNFEEAESLIKEAAEDLKAAHNSQTEMIQGEARGEKQDINVILIHAQDHLTTAMIMLEQAKEFTNIYRILKDLKERG